MNYSHVLYKRGYLISQADLDPPVSTWTKMAVGDYFLSFDPENPWAFSQEGDVWAALLGKAVDVLHWSADAQAIVDHCLNRLGYSEVRMLDYIDHLSGRFILIYHHGHSTKLMTDAFGTRSAFYSLQGPVMIASHCKIIGDLLHASESRQMVSIKKDPRWRVPWARAYPGLLTPYEGIYILTPNTLINLEERKIQRFYPRRELPQGRLSDVVDEVSVMLKRQLSILQDNYKLAISLSGGIDTRTTLAAARDIAGEVLFITYGPPGNLGRTADGTSQSTDSDVAAAIARVHRYQLRTGEMDMTVASDIAGALELRHIRLNRTADHRASSPGLDQVMDCNTYRGGGRTLVHAYLEQLPSDALHIRSNVSGIGKSAYRRQGFSEIPLTAEGMAQVWKAMGDSELVVATFREFAAVVEFTGIMNYDPYDMFLWEHREGTWLTCVLLESDAAFDTFELFNCRALVEKVLSVPVECRMEDAIHRGIIERLWPVLLQWPVNEKPYRQQLEELRAEHAGLESEVQSLRKQTKSLRKARAEHEQLKRKLRTVRASFSYRLGNMLVRAVVNPSRNTILLPYRMVRLCGMEFRKHRAATMECPAVTPPQRHANAARHGTGLSPYAGADLPTKDANCCPARGALIEKAQSCGEDGSEQKTSAIPSKYTEIKLADVTLSPSTAMIKQKYIERFGVDQGKHGAYHETDWRRIECISSFLPEAGSILDIGIGNGAFLNLIMSSHRFQRIVGLDRKLHSKFTTLFDSRLYEIMYASVTKLPFSDRSIDVVTCMEVLEHLDKQSFVTALSELRRVGRFLVVTVPYNEPEPLPSYHKLRFTDGDLLTHFPDGEFILLRKPRGTAWMAIVERL